MNCFSMNTKPLHDFPHILLSLLFTSDKCGFSAHVPPGHPSLIPVQYKNRGLRFSYFSLLQYPHVSVKSVSPLFSHLTQKSNVSPPHPLLSFTKQLQRRPGRNQQILQTPIPQCHPGFRHYGDLELKSPSLNTWFLTLVITHQNVHAHRARPGYVIFLAPQTGIREEAGDGRRGLAISVARLDFGKKMV